MSTIKVKFINNNPYDVTIKWGDAPDREPNASRNLGANKSDDLNITQGKHVFADKYPSAKRGTYLGEATTNNQTFNIPNVK
ncbi:MAG: hypothetical protein RBS19_02515 [Bacteroidales bacterium]|nr:hypothetical protein [Bacteroidales bacterium]MDY0215808.1 hypothetical protein [Bacteroidales bacterium]